MGLNFDKALAQFENELKKIEQTYREDHDKNKLSKSLSELDERSYNIEHRHDKKNFNKWMEFVQKIGELKIKTGLYSSRNKGLFPTELEIRYLNGEFNDLNGV